MAALSLQAHSCTICSAQPQIVEGRVSQPWQELPNLGPRSLPLNPHLPPINQPTPPLSLQIKDEVGRVIQFVGVQVDVSNKTEGRSYTDSQGVPVLVHYDHR
jgi:hypothetical protein